MLTQLQREVEEKLADPKYTRLITSRVLSVLAAVERNRISRFVGKYAGEYKPADSGIYGDVIVRRTFLKRRRNRLRQILYDERPNWPPRNLGDMWLELADLDEQIVRLDTESEAAKKVLFYSGAE